MVPPAGTSDIAFEQLLCGAFVGKPPLPYHSLVQIAPSCSAIYATEVEAANPLDVAPMSITMSESLAFPGYLLVTDDVSESLQIAMRWGLVLGRDSLLARLRESNFDSFIVAWQWIQARRVGENDQRDAAEFLRNFIRRYVAHLFRAGFIVSPNQVLDAIAPGYWFFTRYLALHFLIDAGVLCDGIYYPDRLRPFSVTPQTAWCGFVL